MEKERKEIVNAIESTKDVLSALEIIAKGTNNPFTLNEIAVITKTIVSTVLDYMKYTKELK